MIMTSFAKKILEAFDLRKRRTFREYLESEVTIPEGGREGFKYKCSSRKWVDATVDFFDVYRIIWLAAVSRSGKTLLTTCFGIKQIDERAVTLQSLAPSDEFSIGVIKDKYEPIMKANPRLAELLPKNFGNAEKPSHRIDFKNGGRIHRKFRHQQIKSYDASVIIATEVSEMRESDDEGDMITKAQRRQDEHKGGIQVYESIHKTDKTRFYIEVKAGTDTRLLCPCPHCGEYFEAGARGELYPEENEHGEKHELAGQVKRHWIKGWDVKKREDVKGYIECPHCAGEIYEEHKEEMLNHIKPVHTNPQAEAFSVTVNWMHTNWWTIQDVAFAEWDAKYNWDFQKYADMLQNLYCMPVRENDRLAPEGELREVTTEVLVARARTDYKKGDMPEGIPLVAASIDVQKDWLYWQVLGRGDKGTSLINYGVTEIVPKALQKQIEPTEEMVFAALDSTREMLLAYNPAGIGLDVSYKHQASERPIIKQWAKKHSDVYMISGRAHQQHQKLGKGKRVPVEVQDYIRAYRQQGGGIIYFFDVDKLKDIVQGRLLYPLDSVGRFFFPSDSVDFQNRWLFRHLTSERPIVKVRSGIEISTWEKKPGVTRNDQWDLLIYNYGLLNLFEAQGLRMMQSSGIDSAAAAALGLA